MKIFIVGILLVVCGFSASAQIVDLYEKNPPLHTDPQKIRYGVLAHEKEKKSAIVIIDNRIYSLYDKEYKALADSSIAKINFVSDPASPTDIKTVLIIQTKKYAATANKN